MRKSDFFNFIFLVVFLYLFSFSVHALSIQYVSHQPKYIDFKAHSQAVISYTLDEAARVELRIYDDRDLLINSISSPGVQEKGMHKLTWKANDFKNRRVPAEAYKYVLLASNANEQVEHDLSDFTGGQQAHVFQLKWDKKNKRVNFKVRKASRVNIRVGIKKNGPLMITLSDWLPREHGAHEISWDGYDNSGVFNLNTIEDIEIYAQAFALSENTIIVGPSASEVKLIDDIAWKKEFRTRKKAIKPSMKNHSQQYIENRGDFKVNVVLPDDLKQTADGVAIVKDIVPIRFSLDSKDNQRILNDRYEPILFIDGKYFVENEVGFFPMTWNLDTSLLSEGEHYLTINLRGYNGHLGSASAKIFVQR